VSTKSVMGTTATKRRRNRAWPEALKREIVAASLAPGASVSVVARSYDVNANQVFSWRKRYRDAEPVAAAPRLIPVMVTPDRNAAEQAPQAEKIEIDFGHYRVRVGSAVDAQM
jgi:transposase